MATPSISINLVVTLAGAQPTPPVALNANLINLVSQINPDYTILPGGLIEDLSSTGTYALALIDSAAVELINSISPFTANPWLLVQFGNIYGVPQGEGSNGSVFVVFSGSVGFQLVPGFLVSDGTVQYQVQDGGVVGSSGSSGQIFCLATTSGIFPIPAGTVTQIITSLPPGVTLTCTNPNTGTSQASPQTEDDYRAQVLAAGLVSGQGNASMAKTLMANVPGVQPRLTSVQQVNGGGWEVICGGGDPYAVANAIFDSGLDISTLVGSTIGITAITKANPGVVTTNINHGLTTGQNNVFIAGVLGMTAANGGPYTVTVVSPNQFSFGVNTSGFGVYTSGGVVTPNVRNISVNLNDYPDTYTVPFVNPPAEAVIIQLTWNTISPNFVSSTAVQQLGAPALANYVNSIPVGAPINQFELENVFQAAVASIVPPALLTRMVWTVSINGIDVPPVSGTGVIQGDPESYLTCSATAVIITQG